MSKSSEPDMRPIDFKALEKWQERREWRTKLQAENQSGVFQETKNPSAFQSLEEQSTALADETESKTQSTENHLFNRVYEKFDQTEKKHVAEQSMARHRRFVDILIKNSEVQKTTVDSEHRIYPILEKVAKRIGESEKRLTQTGSLTKETLSDEYSIYVTKRPEVNAFTVPNTKTVFFEAGIITLLDTYLREFKGYGLAEDHIALILAHEISHSDPEAGTMYMNEEYCDVQGMILGAEAGYNPSAAIDIEDFLIWLNEGSEKYKNDDDSWISKIKRIYIPTHPDPQHRRAVLINVLKDNTRVLPNQTKQLSFLESGITENLSKLQNNWQSEAEKRVLPISEEETAQNIAQSDNLSELLDALMGEQLRQQAELARQLMSDEKFVNQITLYQAIAVQLESSVGDYIAFYTKNGKSVSSSVSTTLFIDNTTGTIDKKSGKYNSSDVAIGGLAKQLEKPIGQILDETVAQPIKTEVISELAQIYSKVTVNPDVSYHDYDKSEEERERIYQEAQTEGSVLTEKVNKLLKYIMEIDSNLNLPKLLSGDFTQDETLGAMLNDLGIKNFNAYSSRVKRNLQDLDPNERVKSTLADRTRGLFLSTDFLIDKEENPNEDYLSNFLDKTLSYRMAAFTRTIPEKSYIGIFEHNFGSLSDKLKEGVRKKLRDFSQQFSELPQEQELYYQLMSGIFSRNIGYSHKLELIEQIIASAQNPNREMTTAGIRKSSETQNLTELVENLRVAPTAGGELLRRYINGGSNDTRTGYYPMESRATSLGSAFDVIRVNYGEYYFDEQSGQIKTKERSLPGKLNLISRRKNTLPVYSDYIEESYLEKELLTDENNEDNFETLKLIATESDYSESALKKIIISRDANVEQKKDYLISIVENGEISIQKLFRALKIDEITVYNVKSIETVREKYQVAMAVLSQLPVNPVPQADFNGLLLNESLFEAKLRIMKYDKFSKVEGFDSTKDSFSIRELDEKDLFEGLSEQEKNEAIIDIIVDFINSGGSVSLSSYSFNTTLDQNKYSDESAPWANIRDRGTATGLIRIVRKMGFPTDYISEIVNSLLKTNEGRFTKAERDKWISLVAYTQQPGFHEINRSLSSFFNPEDEKNKGFRLKINNQFVECDKQRVDHLLLALEHIMLLPRCSYRDFCLEQLLRFAHDAITYTVPDGKSSAQYFDHPARDYLEQKLGVVLASAFSDQGFGIREAFDEASIGETAFMGNSMIPASEGLAGDAPESFYLENTVAASIWNKLVLGRKYGETLRTPLWVEYRKSAGFIGMGKSQIELTVLRDRLEFLENMPFGALKEALIAYSLRTAYDNFPEIENVDSFREEFSIIIKNYASEFESIQSRQKLFEILLRLEIGSLDSKINPQSIRDRFASQQEFLDFIESNLPEKTAFRDAYILLASEVYPLEIGDAPKIRNLLFSTDYGTQGEVLKQRSGLEFSRTAKKDDSYHPRFARELIMWLIDKDLQVRTYDELLEKLNSSPKGRRLYSRIVDDYLELGKHFEGLNEESKTTKDRIRNKTHELAIKTAGEIFIRLPFRLKKAIIKEALKMDMHDESDLSFAKKIGMPKDVLLNKNRKEGLWLLGIDTDDITYNSLLDSENFRNPTTKDMFFDLMLGEKGLLEEPVVVDPEGFGERLRSGFDGSEMHKFIDDIVEMVVNKGKLNKNEKNVIRVISHSLIEGMSPVRRATVLYNLVSEIPKVDFSQSDREELKSQVFRIALSSFGVLGAKLGQTDELIPEGWGKSASSLKHSTEPMPFLAVADIFRQEGLSKEYKILSSAGAASTACGYVIESPTGGRQFVKVIRPEILLDWGEDFIAVEHMFSCLKQAGVVKFETKPIINQLKRLVEEELQTGREIDNVVQYVSAETDEERRQREGIRVVKMPLERVGDGRETIERPENSLMIFEELLDQEEFTELSRIKSDPEALENYDLSRINTLVVKDFLYRALELGSWHSDPHEGNIMVSLTGAVKVKLNNEDLVWIDFGQTGTMEGEGKRENAARLLVGLGLYDREEVARAIYEGLSDKNNISIDTIRKELSPLPRKLQDSALKVIARYEVEEYITNFLKASVNILPYLRDLSRKDQFNLISPYISDDIRGKIRTRLIERVVKVKS